MVVEIAKANALIRLQESLTEWMLRNGIETDTTFYHMPEWRERGEDFHNDAELVLVFEGGLYSMINYGGDTGEFDDLIESFGFSYELGYSWSMGFYPLDDYQYVVPKLPYSELLQDSRWKTKSLRVKQRAGSKCQDCGQENSLEAHHCYYLKEHLPWEYPLDAFRCLCEQCHEQRHKEEVRMRFFLARFSQTQLHRMRKGIENAIYQHAPDDVIAVLNAMGHDDAALIQAIIDLIRKRDIP